MEAVIVVIVIVVVWRLTGVLRRTMQGEETEAAINYSDWEPSATALISQRMSYYFLLEEDEKQKFRERTFEIMNSLKFVSREEGFEVTDEMRILVSAAMSQLTFGWKELIPPDLKQIDLFSESFYSRLSRADVKGLTLPGRTMLSWKYFQEGYKVDNDKINLGLHELAHTIWDERYNYESVEEIFTEWESTATTEFSSMQRHIDSGFFRDYAATNKQELWACSVECFFEAPQEFHSRLPEIYRSVANILNQDMIERAQKVKAKEVIA